MGEFTWRVTDFQENCGTIRGSQNKSTWNDLGCGSNLYGIIEID